MSTCPGRRAAWGGMRRGGLSATLHDGDSGLQLFQQLGAVAREGERGRNLFLLTFKLRLQLARP